MDRRGFIALSAAAIAGCSRPDQSEPAISDDSLDVKLSLGKELFRDEPTWVVEDLQELFGFVNINVTVDGPVLYSQEFDTAESASDWWLDRADSSYHADVLLLDLSWGEDDGYAQQDSAVVQMAQSDCVPRVIAHEIAHCLGCDHVSGDTIMSESGACSASSDWSETTKQQIRNQI